MPNKLRHPNAFLLSVISLDLAQALLSLQSLLWFPHKTFSPITVACTTFYYNPQLYKYMFIEQLKDHNFWPDTSDYKLKFASVC